MATFKQDNQTVNGMQVNVGNTVKLCVMCGVCVKTIDCGVSVYVCRLNHFNQLCNENATQAWNYQAMTCPDFQLSSVAKEHIK